MNDTDSQLDEILGALRGTAVAQVRPPGAGAVRRTVERRQTTQRIAAGAAAVAILGGAAGVLALHHGQPDSVTPVPASPAPAVIATPSPAGPPSPDPVPPPRAVGNPLAKVDWPNATLPTPPGQGDCPAATAHFRAGSATGPGGASWRLFGTARGSFTKPVYADVLGDPTPEAIVELDCYVGHPSSYLVVVYTAAADGSPALGGVVTSAGPDLLEWISAVAVKDRVVTVAIHGDPQKAGVAARTTIRNMVWSVSRFVHADPKLAILDADHRAAVYDLPAAGGCPAYSGPVPQPGTTGNWDYGSPTEQATAAVGDLDGDGRDEELAIANCLGDTGGAQVVVALRVSAAGQITTLGTVAVLPHPLGAPLIGALGIGGGRAKITVSGAITQYRWTGEKFTRA
ncbi:MAG: hypothetical protein QOI35_2585 [Cryptosporangiaceae bacterium]|jgi:hypothetical protein|nr:hypothetical protein [Cryptosporangiaceae bacterium]